MADYRIKIFDRIAPEGGLAREGASFGKVPGRSPLRLVTRLDELKLSKGKQIDEPDMRKLPFLP